MGVVLHYLVNTNKMREIFYSGNKENLMNKLEAEREREQNELEVLRDMDMDRQLEDISD